MEWFKISNEGELEFVMEEVKLIPEVQAILTLNYNKGEKDHDGRKKYRAKKEIKYLTLVYSPKSPYKDYTEKERIEESKKDCGFTDTWIMSEELKLLVPKFIKGSTNKASRSLATVEKFLEKFEEFLNNIKLDERNMSGTLVHNPKAIMQTLEQLPSFLLKIEELERQIKQGIVSSPTSRGDQELGWMALNKDTKKPKQEIEEES